MRVRVISIALLVVFWFSLTGDTSVPEVIAALVVMMIALVAYAALQRHGDVPAGARARWIWQALRDWPIRILRETPAALAAAVSRPRGHFRQVDVGDADDVTLAWTIVGSSISPMSYVVGIDEHRRKLLIHELSDTGKSDDEVVWRPR